MTRRLITTLSIGFLLLCPAAPTATKPDLWESWRQNDSASQVRVDHSAWDQFLQVYLVRFIETARVRHPDLGHRIRLVVKRRDSGALICSTSFNNKGGNQPATGNSGHKFAA